MLQFLTNDEERFSEILVRVATQGIEFDGWAGLTPTGISLAGRRLVAVIVDDPQSVDRPDPTSEHD